MSELPEKAFTLSLVNPLGTLFDGEVTFVSAPGILGYFEILYNHAPMIAVLKEGEIVVKDLHGDTLDWRVKGGFLEVSHNRVTLIIES